MRGFTNEHVGLVGRLTVIIANLQQYVRYMYVLEIRAAATCMTSTWFSYGAMVV